MFGELGKAPQVNKAFARTLALAYVMPSTLVGVGGGVQVNVPGMAFAVQAYETWSAEFYLTMVTNNISGILFQFTGPASPTMVNINTWGNNSSATAYKTDTVTAFSTPSANYFASASLTGIMMMRVSLINGASAGVVQLQYAPQSGAGQNILLGSYFTARRM